MTGEHFMTRCLVSRIRRFARDHQDYYSMLEIAPSSQYVIPARYLGYDVGEVNTQRKVSLLKKSFAKGSKTYIVQIPPRTSLEFLPQKWVVHTPYRSKSSKLSLRLQYAPKPRSRKSYLPPELWTAEVCRTYHPSYGSKFFPKYIPKGSGTRASTSLSASTTMSRLCFASTTFHAST